MAMEMWAWSRKRHHQVVHGAPLVAHFCCFSKLREFGVRIKIFAHPNLKWWDGGKGGQSWREGKALVMSNNKGRRNGKVWNKYLLSNPGFAFYQN